jgi:hypothetical protein
MCLSESMVRSIASLVDGARVPSTEVQSLQPWGVIRSAVMQSRPDRLAFIPSGILVLLHWSHLPEIWGGVVILFKRMLCPVVGGRYLYFPSPLLLFPCIYSFQYPCARPVDIRSLSRKGLTGSVTRGIHGLGVALASALPVQGFSLP